MFRRKSIFFLFLIFLYGNIFAINCNYKQYQEEIDYEFDEPECLNSANYKGLGGFSDYNLCEEHYNQLDNIIKKDFLDTSQEFNVDLNNSKVVWFMPLNKPFSNMFRDDITIYEQLKSEGVYFELIETSFEKAFLDGLKKDSLVILPLPDATNYSEDSPFNIKFENFIEDDEDRFLMISGSHGNFNKIETGPNREQLEKGINDFIKKTGIKFKGIYINQCFAASLMDLFIPLLKDDGIIFASIPGNIVPARDTRIFYSNEDNIISIESFVKFLTLMTLFQYHYPFEEDEINKLREIKNKYSEDLDFFNFKKVDFLEASSIDGLDFDDMNFIKYLLNKVFFHNEYKVSELFNFMLMPSRYAIYKKSTNSFYYSNKFLKSFKKADLNRFKEQILNLNKDYRVERIDNDTFIAWDKLLDFVFK